MNEKIAREAMTAIEKMNNVMDTQQKEHFASILTILTTCYGKDAQWRGALLGASQQAAQKKKKHGGIK